MKTYDDLSADELRDELRGRELPVSGTKPEMIARLQEADQAPAAKPTVEAKPSEVATVDLTPANPVHLQHGGACVVDDGRPHVGKAVNGVVCSAHAVTHKPDGTPRRSAP